MQLWYNGRKMVGGLVVVVGTIIVCHFFMTMKSLLCGYLSVWLEHVMTEQTAAVMTAKGHITAATHCIFTILHNGSEKNCPFPGSQLKHSSLYLSKSISQMVPQLIQPFCQTHSCDQHTHKPCYNGNNRLHLCTAYDTIRDAILTCARRPTWVSLILIYRTETTTKKCKTEKLKSKNGYAQK